MFVFIVSVALGIVACGACAALLFGRRKRARFRLTAGSVALVSDLLSFIGYRYLRIVQSGGTANDPRVVFVYAVYALLAAFAVVGILSSVGGSKENRKVS
ncbi:MAG: hypothetical protein LBN30_00495 [Oscillospiraceae bacterium]|jgi:hypothetical protein|nr:hypothetical protein [Oscillospiraceae bacterium]